MRLNKDIKRLKELVKINTPYEWQLEEELQKLNKQGKLLLIPPFRCGEGVIIINDLQECYEEGSE